MDKIIYITIICFWCSLSIQSQQLYFSQHELIDGPEKIQGKVLLEAKDGFIWIGTNQGLYRFDGQDFTSFVLSDSLRRTEEVTALFEAADQSIWIGYASGQIAHLTTNGTLISWQIEEGLPKVPIMGFAQNKNGDLWIATYGEGLYVYAKGRLFNFNIDDGLLGNDIYSIGTDLQGRVWVGTDRGINICRLSADRTKKITAITRDEGLPDDIIRTLLFDDTGNCWVGTYDKGIAQVQGATMKVRTFESGTEQLGPINCLALVEGRELWIGSETKGLFRFDFQSQSYQKMTCTWGQQWGKVHDLHMDVEGNIWVLSNRQGIALAQRQFEFLTPGEDMQNIQAILEDSQQRLWIGNDQGLYRFAPSLDQYDQVLEAYSLNILSLYEDKYGNLWIGTFGDGIYCYDPEGGAIRHITEADGLSNGSVLSIDGMNGHVWMATLGGVTEFEYKKDVLDGGVLSFKNYSENSNLGTNFIYKVFIDKQDRTWFGTDGKGISVWENGMITNLPEAKGEPLKGVYSITEDDQGHIWFSTARNGIYEYADSMFSHLAMKEGIRDLEISSLITDTKGNILLVHPSGIDVLDPESHHLIYYDEEVNIGMIEPNLNAVCRGANGTIWIGTQDQIIRYTALDQELSIHPRTQLTGVSSFLDPFPFQTGNKFSYDQNSLIFEYVGLWYSDPSSVKYRYKLENFNQGWISSRDRKATYPNLPPGSYTFKVMSTENEAFDDEPIVSYDFVIVPPVWARWWFILLVAGLLTFLLFYYLRTREQRLEKEANLKKGMVESQFEALKSQINPHFLFNTFNTLVTLIEEEPDIAVHFVEHLSDFYRSILQYRERDLIPLKEELDLVKNYAYLVKNRFGDNLILKIDIYHAEVIQVAPLTLQMLVENAIKHNVIAQSKPLYICVRQDGTHILVSNNLQPKLTQSPSTGFGLQNISSRYALLSQKEVEVEKNDSEFIVRIPIIKKQAHESVDY